MKTRLPRKLILIMLLILVINGFSQKFIPYTGDIKVIKDEKTLNVQFFYDKMKVGEFNSEKEYTDHRVKEYDDKKQGKGAEWLAEWNSYKKIWENNFIKDINKRLKKQSVVFSLDQKQAKYMLLLYPLFLDIGFDAVMVSKASELDVEILIFESEHMENQIARIMIDNSLGGGAGWKGIGFTYNSLAKKFGKFLKKNVY
jgi:hypothetical protein